MGNLRDKYTDEEWDELCKEIFHNFTFKNCFKLGLK